ncbi:hypothetical protein SDC9_207198 [bioreactor metagenome]|uniref:Uncharacterized protein n=1 Tax=bioreactor metagenome TaxID=1076179 RepID=A0A645J7V5_9ZZZZ
MDILRQRLAQHIDVLLHRVFHQPFGLGVAVWQAEGPLLTQSLESAAEIVDILRRPHARHPGQHQEGIGELYPVVHPVAAQQVVGIDLPQHLLKVAALLLVVAVLHHRHAGKGVGFPGGFPLGHTPSQPPA